MADSNYSDEELATNFRTLMRRYGASPDAFIGVLCPLLLPIHSLDKTIHKVSGQSHFRASFTVLISDENQHIVQRGRTGKFVPAAFGTGELWREIAKGRFTDLNRGKNLGYGEIYIGGNKRAALELALENLDESCLLEIDQYGAAAKVLSGLAEFYLVKNVTAAGYKVVRMPEDMAKHLGYYANYDFEFEKAGVTKKIEVKSIWGTNTEFARLIHSTTTRPKGNPSTWTPEQTKNYYPTSSCKFSTQDIFAVSLFLRTGNIEDFAFARSVSSSEQPHGLPSNSKYPDHVNQNPRLEIGDGTWFATLDEVWDLP